MTDHEINAFASATALDEVEATEATLVPRAGNYEGRHPTDEVTEEVFVTSEGPVATAADVIQPWQA